MSCQPLIQRTVDAALGPVLRDINRKLQQAAGQWNRQFPGVTVPHAPATLPGVQQAAYGLGTLIGAAVRPLLPRIPIPVAVQEQEAHALGQLVAAMLGQPEHAVQISREVDTCIAHTLSDLITGHLFKEAAVKVR
jgi:hypothetical protein